MREHMFCVDACIRSAGKSECNRLAKNRSKGFFHHFLYGYAIRLSLRAVESSTIICKINEVAHDEPLFPIQEINAVCMMRIYLLHQ